MLCNLLSEKNTCVQYRCIRGNWEQERVGKRRRRQQAAGEFRYDAISYALNFEEDGGGEGGGEGEPFKYRAFSSRLPASPPPPLPETAVATDRRS